ncbi:hypothetical protein BDV93DRAFT_575572 [Ceratobasidium sp. AG-I]|nr:hypothetical protein BDV93DRAFT_575572 [Ceratobasidium sp. AG-I]
MARASPSLVNTASLAIRNARRRAGGISVRLKWCLGHMGVRCSLEVSMEAKAAATGKAFDAELLPQKLLTYRPPKNSKTVKKITKENEFLAREHWLLSAAGTKLLVKHPEYSAHDFLNRIKGLPRARASLLFQLSTGHAPLQSYLFRLQVVNTRICPKCGDAPETAAHHHLRCCAFAEERHAHLARNGLEHLNLSFLFSSPLARTPFRVYQSIWPFQWLDWIVLSSYLPPSCTSSPRVVFTFSTHLRSLLVVSQAFS